MVSSGPENSKLIIPEGMIRNDNPVSAALSANLQCLDKSLTPDETGHINYVPAAWHFREVIDFISIFMAAKIEKTTIIGDVLDIAPETAPLFMAIGMHCLGCPSSRGETVEEACAVHGIDVDKLLALVNEEANK